MRPSGAHLAPVVILVALASCDQVWGIHDPPPPPDAAPDAPPPDAPPPPPVELRADIAASTDDTLDDPYGIHPALGWCTIASPGHAAGLRFALPGIARGARIDAAALEVYVDGTDIDTPNLEIRTEASAAPAPFGTVDGELDARPLGAAVVTWQAEDIGFAWRTSPSLVDLVRERIEAADWDAQTGHIVFVLRGTATSPREGFEFRQWDNGAVEGMGGGGFAARLRVTYANPVR